MLWAVFCWKSFGPTIHVDQVQPFMATVFPNCSVLFQQYDAPCHTAKPVQKWFDKVHGVDLASKFPIEHLWVMLDKKV